MKLNFPRVNKETEIIFAGQMWEPSRNDIRLIVQDEGNIYDITNQVSSILKYRPLRENLKEIATDSQGNIRPGVEASLLSADPMAEAFSHAHDAGMTPFELFSRALDKKGEKTIIKDAEIDIDPNLDKPHKITPIRCYAIGIGVTYDMSQEARTAGIADKLDTTTFNPYMFAKECARKGYRVESFVKADLAPHFSPPNGYVGLSTNKTKEGRTIYSAIEPELAGILNTRTGLYEALCLSNDVSMNLLEEECLLWLPEAKKFMGGLSIGPLLMLLNEPTNAVSSIDIVAKIEREGVGIDPLSGKTTDIVMDNYSTITKTLQAHNVLPDSVIVSIGAVAVPKGKGKTYLPGDNWEIRATNVNLSPEENIPYVLKGGTRNIPASEPREINPNYDRATITRAT